MAAHDLSRTTGVYLLLPRHAAELQALEFDPVAARLARSSAESGAAAFVAGRIAEREAGTAAWFAIEDRGTLVGVCGLGGIEGDVARELGAWVGAPFRGKGYATFALGVVLEYAFRNRELREVRACVDASDGAARRVLEKGGLRRADAPGCTHAITAEEWRALRDGPALARLHPGLRRILDAELRAGNEVVESRAGWPDADSVFVRLRHPFRAAPPAVPAGLRYAELDDPHWWKAEYRSDSPRHILAC
jgi:RimJ/RimL family protein N-acetyltransferase